MYYEARLPSYMQAPAYAIQRAKAAEGGTKARLNPANTARRDEHFGRLCHHWAKAGDK